MYISSVANLLCSHRAFIRVFLPVYTNSRRDWHFANLSNSQGTTQVCLFRDSYEPLTADGLAIYGLSADSPKANTTFKEKQKLPYPLLCDTGATLIAAIGLKKQPKGTQRGVFVISKEGKVLVAEPGGPAATVERVKALVEELKGKN